MTILDFQSTVSRCIDVDTTLYKHHVPAGR